MDPSDSEGRKALKQEIREKTPKTVADVIESSRPSTDAQPGSGGTANRSNPAVDSLGKAFKWGGRGLVAATLIVDAYDLYKSTNIPLTLMRTGGGIIGAYSFGAAGAVGGVLFFLALARLQEV